MKFLYLLFTPIVLFGCREHQSYESQTLDFGRFSIQVPKKWQKIELQGVDSEVGGFVTENNDTISFDLGFYSNNLEDSMPVLMDSALWETTSDDIKESYRQAGFVMVENVHHVDEDIFRTTNIAWDTVDGLKCKIKIPIIKGKGITGVYFDSISHEYDRNIKFNLYGNNLNVKAQEELLKAIPTIRFKR